MRENVKIKGFNGKVEELSNSKHIPSVKVTQLTKKDEEQRIKQCDGKVKHGSMLAAQEILYNCKDNMEIYPCKYCGGFHLGHVNQKQNDKKTKGR